MNALTKDLTSLTEAAERNAVSDGRFRQKFHLMPPTGWLNDPNGLCQYGGIYHAFFQYSPFNAEGGVKMWGHCTSKDMVDWKYEGVSMYPDQPFDCHGVYSGAALVEDGAMYLYYTGNVKLDGDYDYINTGREANTCLVVSRDGHTFGRKEELMRNSDYPSDLTLHVRDPKVWKEQDAYYMIQGARRKDHVGTAVLFRSEDKRDWTYCGRIETEEPFGYMWECPDYFTVDGRTILSASVQGLTGGIWDSRNVYQSGWFTVDGDILDKYSLSEYQLWDYGFDYYAPQSFETEDGRRIQIGWMGMPDCEEYTNRTLDEGWQHCFTFPREILSGTDRCASARSGNCRSTSYRRKRPEAVMNRTAALRTRFLSAASGRINSGRFWRKNWCWSTGKAGLRCGLRIRAGLPFLPDGDCGMQRWKKWKMSGFLQMYLLWKYSSMTDSMYLQQDTIPGGSVFL